MATGSPKHMVTKVIDCSIKDTCIQGIEATRKHDLTCLLACPTIVYPTYVGAREMILHGSLGRKKKPWKLSPRGWNNLPRGKLESDVFTLNSLYRYLYSSSIYDAPPWGQFWAACSNYKFIASYSLYWRYNCTYEFEVDFQLIMQLYIDFFFSSLYFTIFFFFLTNQSNWVNYYVFDKCIFPPGLLFS